MGVIELKQDCAFVAVPKSIADALVVKLNNAKLKKKKVRVTAGIKPIQTTTVLFYSLYGLFP